MGTPVTSLELRECLEHMAKMFNKKLEDVALSSRMAVSRQEPLHVLELPANDIKLEMRDCYTCGKKGHLRWTCPLTRDTRREHTGRGRGAQRTGRRWRGGRGRAGGRGATNLAVTEETQFTEVFGDAEYRELE